MVRAKVNGFKCHRIKCGFHQKQLAEKINMTANTLAQIENGHKGTRPQTAKKICEALNADFDELFEIVEKR